MVLLGWQGGTASSSGRLRLGSRAPVAGRRASCHASAGPDRLLLGSIVCVGGDGMFSEVLHGLIGRTQRSAGVDQNQPRATLVPSPLRIGIIPAGTEPARAWPPPDCPGLSSDPRPASRCLQGRVLLLLLWVLHSAVAPLLWWLRSLWALFACLAFFFGAGEGTQASHVPGECSTTEPRLQPRLLLSGNVVCDQYNEHSCAGACEGPCALRGPPCAGPSSQQQRAALLLKSRGGESGPGAQARRGFRGGL